MSGNTQKRQRADAIRAAKMKGEGATSREIAAALGLKPEQVKARVLLGLRLMEESQPSGCPTETLGG